jgi:hypothetical protein
LARCGPGGRQRTGFAELKTAKRQGRKKHSGSRQTGSAAAPNRVIERNSFRIPLAGGIDGTNP